MMTFALLLFGCYSPSSLLLMFFWFTPAWFILSCYLLPQARREYVWSFWTSLWIKTTYISSGVKVDISHITSTDHRSTRLTYIPSASVYTRHVFPWCVFARLCSLACVASTVQTHNWCRVTEYSPFLTSAHISCEMCFNEVKDDIIVF